MTDIIFYGQFVASKLGKDSLTPTVDIERITRSDGTRSALVTGGSASTVGRRGLYYYRLADANLNLYDYVATFITTDATVDQKEIPALWTYFSSPIVIDVDGNISISASTVSSIGDDAKSKILENSTKINGTYIDAAISSRATSLSGTGSTQFLYSVTDGGGTVIPAVRVIVSTDTSQQNIVASGYTDTFGNITFYLDPGTYYFWCSKSGYTFTNPDTEVVS